MNRIIAFFAILFYTGNTPTTYAEEGFRSIIINKTDNTQVGINLSDELTTTFSNETMYVSSNTIDVAFPLCEMKDWRFDTEIQEEPGEGAGISQKNAMDNAIAIKKGNQISFSNILPNSKIAVYNLKGKLLYSTQATGSHTLQLDDLPSGTYIITINKQSFKTTINR